MNVPTKKGRKDEVMLYCSQGKFVLHFMHMNDSVKEADATRELLSAKMNLPFL